MSRLDQTLRRQLPPLTPPHHLSYWLASFLPQRRHLSWQRQISHWWQT